MIYLFTWLVFSKYSLFTKVFWGNSVCREFLIQWMERAREKEGEGTEGEGQLHLLYGAKVCLHNVPKDSAGEESITLVQCVGRQRTWGGCPEPTKAGSGNWEREACRGGLLICWMPKPWSWTSAELFTCTSSLLATFTWGITDKAHIAHMIILPLKIILPSDFLKSAVNFSCSYVGCNASSCCSVVSVGFIITIFLRAMHKRVGEGVYPARQRSSRAHAQY